MNIKVVRLYLFRILGRVGRFWVPLVRMRALSGAPVRLVVDPLSKLPDSVSQGIPMFTCCERRGYVKYLICPLVLSVV